MDELMSLPIDSFHSEIYMFFLLQIFLEFFLLLLLLSLFEFPNWLLLRKKPPVDYCFLRHFLKYSSFTLLLSKANSFLVNFLFSHFFGRRIYFLPLDKFDYCKFLFCIILKCLYISKQYKETDSQHLCLGLDLKQNVFRTFTSMCHQLMLF